MEQIQVEQSTVENGLVITGVKIPFWSAAGLIVKWTFAAIPAALILLLITAILKAVINNW